MASEQAKTCRSINTIVSKLVVFDFLTCTLFKRQDNSRLTINTWRECKYSKNNLNLLSQKKKEKCYTRHLFCSTFPSVPVFHLMMVHMYGQKVSWKIKDEHIEYMSCVCVDCIC